jgi:hypothetical protein
LAYTAARSCVASYTTKSFSKSVSETPFSFSFPRARALASNSTASASLIMSARGTIARPFPGTRDARECTTDHAHSVAASVAARGGNSL